MLIFWKDFIERNDNPFIDKAVPAIPSFKELFEFAKIVCTAFWWFILDAPIGFEQFDLHFYYPLTADALTFKQLYCRIF